MVLHYNKSRNDNHSVTTMYLKSIKEAPILSGGFLGSKDPKKSLTKYNKL